LVLGVSTRETIVEILVEAADVRARTTPLTFAVGVADAAAIEGAVTGRVPEAPLLASHAATRRPTRARLVLLEVAVSGRIWNQAAEELVATLAVVLARRPLVHAYLAFGRVHRAILDALIEIRPTWTLVQTAKRT
jgi:hypothetical protein